MDKNIKLDINVKQPDFLKDVELVTIKGKQGEKGEKPVKGEDYFTEKDIEEIEDDIKEDLRGELKPVKGVDYFDGKDGVDGVDGKDGKDGVDGKDGKDGIDGETPDIKSVVSLAVKEVVKKIPKPTPIKAVKYADIKDAPNIEEFKDEVTRFVNQRVSSKDYSLKELTDVSVPSPTNNQVLKYNATTGKWQAGTDTAGSVDSVTASNSTLTISPTTGAVLASLNLANNNTWTGIQHFEDPVEIRPQATSGGLIIAPTGANNNAAIRLYGRGGSNEQYTNAWISSGNAQLRLGSSDSIGIQDGASPGSGQYIINMVASTHVLNHYTTGGALVNSFHPAGSSYITGGDFGIGTTSPSARLHIIKTTEQARIGYDTSNYYKTTVSSIGLVTFDAFGTTPSFLFTDEVKVQTGSYIANLTRSSGATTYSAEFTSTNSTARLGMNDLSAGYFTYTGGAEAILAGSGQAGYFSAGTTNVTLADTTYAVNASGAIVINSNKLYMNGSTISDGISGGGFDSINPTNRELIGSDGSTVVADWSTPGFQINLAINDNTSVNTILPTARQLIASDGTTVIADWSGPGGFTGLTGANGLYQVDITNGQLVNATSGSVDWVNNKLYATTAYGLSIDWEARLLKDSGGSTTMLDYSNAGSNGVTFNPAGTYNGRLGSATEAGYFTDGATNQVYLADGSYAINATGNVYVIGNIDAVSSNSTYEGALASTTYAGYFTDTSGNYLYLSDSTYAINSTGQAHFVPNGGGSTVLDIMPSGYAMTWNVPSFWGGNLAGSGGAAYFYDSNSNNVYLADGTYAINATGGAYLNGDIYVNVSGTPTAGYTGDLNDSTSTKIADVVNGIITTVYF